ncbi:SDR family NAD(P)-dependent oxidoreductase [Amaricoccus sp. W119]|uniref:SDR family NAD(P)-dependent oxidoreductase n=1 Tax=Amaricoccus sp. W119 TaxID=3391833 RepID=UPI0039A60FDF
MAGRLTGKTAIVTGAASGIGLAITRAFLAEGAVVAMLDRDAATLETEAARLETAHEAAGGGATGGGEAVRAFACDVARADQVAAAVAEAAGAFGPINTLVNNAGISIPGGLEEMPEEAWDRIFSVNVKSVYLVSREVIPMMRASGGGSIINVASESAFIGFAMHPAYCASKAAVVHLSRSMAARYAKDGIRANALCPGTIDTPLYRGFIALQDDPEAVGRAVEEMHPLGIGVPDDIAYAAVFLASDESRYATGAPFLIDGGATAI